MKIGQHVTLDRDIVEWLETKPNKSGLINETLREVYNLEFDNSDERLREKRVELLEQRKELNNEINQINDKLLESGREKEQQLEEKIKERLEETKRKEKRKEEELKEIIKIYSKLKEIKKVEKEFNPRRTTKWFKDKNDELRKLNPEFRKKIGWNDLRTYLENKI